MPAKRAFTLPSKSASESTDKWSFDISEKDFISRTVQKVMKIHNLYQICFFTFNRFAFLLDSIDNLSKNNRMKVV